MQTSKAFFEFPDIKGNADFSFEKLTSENFHQQWLLFEGDDSAFTDNRFMQFASAEKFAIDLEKYGRFSPKH